MNAAAFHLPLFPPPKNPHLVNNCLLSFSRVLYIYYFEYLPTRTWQVTVRSVKPEYDEASFNCGFVCRAQTKELLWGAVGRPGS